MGNYEQLKAAISNVIKTNGNQEITGKVLQNSLIAIINSLGKNYQFAGIATTSTNPGTPDENIFYLAGPGTYTNFSNINIDMGELGVLQWHGLWSKQTIKIGFTPNELNISTLFPTKGEGGTNRYILGSAIEQVPIDYRTNIGLKITFINNETNKPQTWVYNGGVFLNIANWKESNDNDKLINLQNETNLLKGIVITSDKIYSDINVDITNLTGSETWYSNRAYPNVSSVSGVKINARNNGSIELCIFNKVQKTKTIVESINVNKGIGEYNFKVTHSIDINSECFYIQNTSGSFVLYKVASDKNFPVITSENIDTTTFKGDVLLQLITYSNLQDELKKTQIELGNIKTETDKIAPIENHIKQLDKIVKIGIIEKGKCGIFDIPSKTILADTSRFYKKISLGKTKKLIVDFNGGGNYKVIVFKKDNIFSFYVVCEINTILNIESIIKLTEANNAYIISQYELSDDKIKLEGNFIEPSVDNILSGNIWNDEYVICKGQAVSSNNILGIQMIASYADVALFTITRNNTIYHNQYLNWKLYNIIGDFVSVGAGDLTVNIETGEADYMIIQRPISMPNIISYNKELTQYKGDIPYYANNILTQQLESTKYKGLSNSALIEVLKKNIYDKYVGKSIFFVGDSYASGDNAKEYGGYPNDFANRHPLSNTQLGSSYIWSGRTISTYTTDNILKSVLKICTENGYMKTTLNYPLTDTAGLQYTRNILFDNITEIDKIIARKNASNVTIYSVNKETFEKTEIKRIFMQKDVTEYTFREKIKAKDGECIGLDFSANFAYKADGNTFKSINGTIINGSPLVQVCCNRCDYLIMEGGLNDMYLRGTNPETNVIFGSLLDPSDYTTNSFDDKTFCGALEHMVRESVFKLKATKLGFLIMPQPGDDIWNNQYAKAIKDVCDKYGVPYLDMGNLKRMKIASLDSEASRDFWCVNTDGTFNYHPSAIGYYVMMNDAINSFIDSL